MITIGIAILIWLASVILALRIGYGLGQEDLPMSHCRMRMRESEQAPLPTAMEALEAIHRLASK